MIMLLLLAMNTSKLSDDHLHETCFITTKYIFLGYSPYIFSSILKQIVFLLNQYVYCSNYMHHTETVYANYCIMHCLPNLLITTDSNEGSQRTINSYK